MKFLQVMVRKSAWTFSAASILFVFGAYALVAYPDADNTAASIHSVVLMWLNGSGNAQPASAANPLPVSSAYATTASPTPTIGAPAPLSVDAHGVLRIGIYDPSGAAVDLTQPQPVIPYPSSSLTIAQVSCPATANGVLLIATNVSAKQRSFSNISGATIYVGPPSVSTANGFPIPTGAVAINPFPGYTGELDCIVAAASATMTVSQQQ